MHDFDSLTDRRIDSATADLVDRLTARYLPGLAPCDLPLAEVLDRLAQSYPLTALPPDSIHCARTALAVIEADFPEDAAYLPVDPDDRQQAALALARTLRLDIRCLEVRQEDAGAHLYEQQAEQFARRTAGFGLTWTPMPIRICAETGTGYCLVTGSEELADRITCLRGVSRADIDRRTPALIAYLRAKYGAESV